MRTEEGRTMLRRLDWVALARRVVGLGVGFLGAFVTLQAIERFASATDPTERTELVLGQPDFDAYCRRDADRDLDGVLTDTDAFGWQCVGFVQSFWTAERANAAEVCAWQFGVEASARLVDESSPDGWRCVTSP
jgi:hypothetical protein